jgi:hypothetical protein
MDPAKLLGVQSLIIEHSLHKKPSEPDYYRIVRILVLKSKVLIKRFDNIVVNEFRERVFISCHMLIKI